jgi:hypothetical protein
MFRRSTPAVAGNYPPTVATVTTSSIMGTFAVYPLEGDAHVWKAGIFPFIIFLETTKRSMLQ